MLNYLVRFGWSHGDQEVFSIPRLIEAFNWEACGRGDGKFDTKKFLAIQQEHMKSQELTPDAEFAERVMPFLAKRGLHTLGKADVQNAIFTVRERSRTFVEAADALDFFFRDPQTKFLTASNASNLRSLAAMLEQVSTWTEQELDARTHAWLSEKQLQIKDIAQPARVALTGRSSSPGLFQVMFVLGKARSLERLAHGAALGESALHAMPHKG